MHSFALTCSIIFMSLGSPSKLPCSSTVAWWCRTTLVGPLMSLAAAAAAVSSLELLGLSRLGLGVSSFSAFFLIVFNVSILALYTHCPSFTLVESDPFFLVHLCLSLSIPPEFQTEHSLHSPDRRTQSGYFLCLTQSFSLRAMLGVVWSAWPLCVCKSAASRVRQRPPPTGKAASNRRQRSSPSLSLCVVPSVIYTDDFMI